MSVNGVVLYYGPSMIDGQPIVAIATGLSRDSENTKTGGMVQTYILRADMLPTEAVRTRADVSICGGCIFRGTPATDDTEAQGRMCYVNVGQGPQVVWRAWRRNAYARTFPHTLFAGKVVRIGSYGDPAAVPVQVWTNVLNHCAAHTAYTHQWRTHPELAGFAMASADTEADAMEAQRLGWRTFYVALKAGKRRADEARCPASAEAGHKLQCSECLACDGKASGRRGNITIQAHGGFAVMANVHKRTQA